MGKLSSYWTIGGALMVEKENKSMFKIQVRKSVIAVSFIAAFLFLLVVRLVNEVNFPLLLNCFGQPGTKWIPFSYTYRRPLRTHYGYINVRTQEPLQLDCDLCAIVSNSGQMVGQKVGNEIDQSSCIWRMNNAPTKGYEEDVGRMTMIRVVSHTSVPLLLKNPDYFFKEANATIYVIWGPFRNMRKDGNGIVYNMLKKTVDIYPSAQIYVTTEKRMSYCDGVFKKETGKDRTFSHTKYPNATGRDGVPPGQAGSAGCQDLHSQQRALHNRWQRAEVSDFPGKGGTPRNQGSEKLAGWDDSIVR
ncbi:alpha-N-acetylgalactosaminide alpha-2,6-sialyltransferase 3 isoform 3-T3 [Molossus nigricans]